MGGGGGGGVEGRGTANPDCCFFSRAFEGSISTHVGKNLRRYVFFAGTIEHNGNVAGCIRAASTHAGRKEKEKGMPAVGQGRSKGVDGRGDGVNDGRMKESLHLSLVPQFLLFGRVGGGRGGLTAASLPPWRSELAPLLHQIWRGEGGRGGGGGVVQNTHCVYIRPYETLVMGV
jgi:hypothetical protein